MRTRVKICGITNSEDALKAAELGADALGFILVPETPRYVGGSWTRLYEIFRDLPPFLKKVAVFKQCEEHDHPEWIQSFDALQFYKGNCSTTVTGNVLCIRAFRIRDKYSLDEMDILLKTIRFDAILLDTYHKDKLGGAGETFNWDLALEAKTRFDLPMILAGGLTSENVGEAIRKVHPYAVDVSSGVEAEPGRKDHLKLREFFRAVAKADREMDAVE